MIGLYVTTLLVEIDVVSGDFGAGDTLTLDGAPPSSCPQKHITGCQSHLPLSLLKNILVKQAGERDLFFADIILGIVEDKIEFKRSCPGSI